MKRLLLVTCFLTFCAAHTARAAGPYVSGIGGFVTLGDAGSVGGGGGVGYDTGDIFGLDLSLLYSKHNGYSKLNIPVALHAKIWEFNQLKTYLRLGAGFETLNGSNFFLDFGFGGDYWVSKNLGLGLIFRYDPVFDAPDAGLVLLRVTFQFDTGGGDDIWN